MKHSLPIFILLLISHFAYSQCEIDNPSFETWTDQPLEVETINGDVFMNDIALPDSTVSVVRFFLQAFGVFFDPSIGQQLEDDPQGFIGISQSDDASEGAFAVRLQGTPELSVADIYSPNECTEVPDSFHFDIKHENSGGITDDTLIVFLAFDMGLSPLPEDSTDVANSPYSAYTEIIYNMDTDYHTVSLPIVNNFDQEIDTFYYLILTATHDGSSFLVDNLRFENDNGSDCFFDDYADFTIESDIKACFCNDFSETILLDNVTQSDDFDVIYLVVDEDNLITEISEVNSSFIEQDLCFEETSYLVEARYTDVVFFDTGMNLSELEGCFALSDRKEITGEMYDEFFWDLKMNGMSAQEDISICLQDDIIDVFEFDYDTDRMATVIVFEFGSLEVVDQFDIPATKTFEELTEGETYSMGILTHDEPLPNLIGVNAVELQLQFTECIQASQNGYFLTIEELGTGNCTSSTQDPGILNAIQIINNPVAEQLNISIDNSSEDLLNMQIINLNGQAVSNIKEVNKQQNIDWNVNHLPAGLYILNVQSETGQASFKFLKM